jgi:hypothetical protein
MSLKSTLIHCLPFHAYFFLWLSIPQILYLKLSTHYPNIVLFRRYYCILCTIRLDLSDVLDIRLKSLLVRHCNTVETKIISCTKIKLGLAESQGFSITKASRLDAV